MCCGLHPLMNQRGAPALVQTPAASSWPTPFPTVPSTLRKRKVFYYISWSSWSLLSSCPPKEVCCGLHPLMNQRGAPALVQTPAASSWPTPFPTVPSTLRKRKVFYYISWSSWSLLSSCPPKEVCCGLHPLMNQRGAPALVQTPAASSWPTPFPTVPST